MDNVLYSRLMRFSKKTLFDMCREVSLKAPRGYCWTATGQIQDIEGAAAVPGASKDDAARALVSWLQP